ncbi:hypothetical protein R1sor_021220 [Riccia sorocarpa]|uniref:Uncharacterized protein n=1 Tax=Riccia sorocarpa TaxID=122646 RepID=A0ABD3GKN3_9MARC
MDSGQSVNSGKLKSNPHLNLHEAYEKDRNKEKEEPEELQKQLDKAYLHPVLKEEQEIGGKFKSVKSLKIRHNPFEDEDYDDDHSDEEGGGGGGAAVSDRTLIGNNSDVRLEVMDAVPSYSPKSNINKSSELLLAPAYGQMSDGAPAAKHTHKKSYFGGGSSFKHNRQRNSEGSSARHQKDGHTGAEYHDR